jgi:hypothetical protein
LNIPETVPGLECGATEIGEDFSIGHTKFLKSLYENLLVSNPSQGKIYAPKG